MFRITLIVILGAFVLSCAGKKTDSHGTRMVQSSGSPEPSSEIPEKREFPVNPNVNPCDDFYEYACSPAINSFKLREDRSRHIFSFFDSDERILTLKKKYIADLSKQTKLSKRAATLNTIYAACMNEQASAQEEKVMVSRAIIKMEDIKTRDELMSYSTTRLLEGDYSFFEFGSDSNLDNSDWYDVIILANINTLPERSYYDMKPVMADFEALVTEFFKTLGATNAEKRAKAVVAFEKEFMQTYPLPAEMRELFAQKSEISRKDLLDNYAIFHLKPLVDLFPKKTLIRNITPTNFDWLKLAFEKTDLDVLKDVFTFHTLKDVLDDAYPAYFARRFEFNRKHLGGPNVRPERQERCTKYVMNRFDKEFDAEVLPLMFKDFPEKQFIALAEKVRATIIKGIQKNDWLSPESKKGAIEKMSKARLQLVKPKTAAEWDFNPPASYSKETRYENDRLLNKVLMKKTIKELAQKRDRSRWGMGPMTVNAYYSPDDNKFVMPIGILQYPFYDVNGPEHVNLGAVGAVIGHELGHGIDDIGARFDYRGRLHQWMSDEDVAEFKKRGSSLGGLFDKAGVNGKLTLGENIGDLVGVSFAYNTAFDGNKAATPAMKREFFTQYARLWCGVVREKERERLLKSDPHSPIEARVREQVKHQPGFQEAFGCKASDKMVLPPDQRVKIW